jgi:hypothetical protein
VQHACLIMNGNFLKGYLHSGQHRADFKTVYILLWVCDAILKQPRSILRRLVGADHPSSGQNQRNFTTCDTVSGNISGAIKKHANLVQM